VKEKISVSPQETAIASNLTVKENLQLIAELYGNNKKDAVKKANEMIESFGLAEVTKTRAKTLSGGWQRRLSIAMALISNPQILFQRTSRVFLTRYKRFHFGLCRERSVK